MNKDLKFSMITTAILLVFIMICAGITVTYGYKLNKRLKEIDRDVKKRPVIEYHYYENCNRKGN